MFENLKKKMAKVALIAIALQLVVFGLGGGATGAQAGAPDDTFAPTANVVYDTTTGNITYTFSEPVQLRNNDDSPAILTPDKLAIFEVIAGNYDLSTKTTNTIDTAVLSDDLMSMGITYEGSLIRQANTDYVVDAWGYKITDLAGNQMLPSLLQVFTVNGDSISPMASVLHDDIAKTITYTFNEPVELRNNDGTPAIVTADKFAIYEVVGGDYDLTTKTTNVITDVALSSDGLSTVITYEGSLVKITDANYVVDAWGYKITDLVGNKMLASELQIFTVSGDITKAVVTMTSKPVIVNNIEEAIEVTFVGDESISLSSATIEFVQGTVTYSAPALDVVAKDAKTLIVTIPADTFAKGTEAIAVTADFADVAGNVTNFVGSIEVDTVAPAAVTGLTLLLDKNTGNVTLAWVNPTAGTYESIIIKRIGNDGSIAKFVTSGPTVIGYVDDTTQRGVTYDYIVLVVDAAGNSTATAPASILVPNIVVAVATTVTTTTGTVDFEESDSSNEVAVTAEVDEDVAAATDTTDTEEDGLPIWGIILLIFIAAVGAYLIWSQKPAPQAERIFIEEKKNTKTKPEKPVNDNAPKKKSSSNNKKTNKKK